MMVFLSAVWDNLHAQDSLTNLRKKYIQVQSQPMRIDSLSIVPGTFQTAVSEQSDYYLDEVNATIRWIHPPALKYVWIQYRVFPVKLNAATQRFNYDSIRYNFIAGQPVIIKNASAKGGNLFNFGNIQTDGSIGRSITFGNSRDANVNSSMNLRLHGFIADSLEISAAITDNNIPIQPEGNTRDLRDFDRIFFQAKKKNWQVDVGDLDLREQKNYFLNFYKRIQGISVSSNNQIGKASNHSLLSGAIARGKFNRQILTPSEGNQGPYRLKGANNEFYFVILAGTERVFIDGEKLQRGEDQDYVINYNTAELTFTPKRLINKDLRIWVEFEYTDRNYLNSNIYATNTIKLNKSISVTASYFANTDAKNTSIDQVLSEKQKQFLANIGDSIQNAYYPTAVKDTFSINRILYKKIDTIYNGNLHDSVFVLSNDPTIQLYNVGFSYVGTGRGNYIPVRNAVNGQAFQWIAPDVANNKLGDWEPVALLVTPKKLHIANIVLAYNGNKNMLTAEGAMSNYDINLFSSKNKSDNKDFAFKLKWENKGMPLKLMNQKITIYPEVGIEWVGERFRPLERLRNVEFLRDWGLPYENTAATDKLLSAGIKFQSEVSNYFRYNVINYHRSDGYNGYKHQAEWAISVKGWKLSSNTSYLLYNKQQLLGKFLRPSIDLSKQLTKLNRYLFSMKYFGEYNHEKNILTDTLTPLSFGFSVFDASIKSDGTKANRWGISYFRRVNGFPVQTKILNADRSNNYSIFTELTHNENAQLKMNLTYRSLQILNKESKQKEDKSLVGRTEYYLRAFRGLFTGNILYELGAGQEQRREFSYAEVPAGQGVYMWIDYNGDGIPQLNEFENAIYPDQKKYIRIFTPGSEYVKANYLQFNYTIDIEPGAVIGLTEKGISKWLKRISSSSALQIGKKKIYRGSFLFNPFSNEIIDTSLVSLSSYFSNTIYYNRKSSTWGMELTHSRNATKALLAYGFESRQLDNLLTRVRVNLNQQLISNLTLRKINNVLNTTGSKFSNRNFDIRQYVVEPSLTYIYRSVFRTVLSYIYSSKYNRIDSLEKAISHALSADIRYNILSSSTFNAKLTYNYLKYKAYPGAESTTSGFTMLEGLLPGKNLIWSMEFTRQFANSIELSLQYEGRKPAETAVIHTGRASLRAIF